MKIENSTVGLSSQHASSRQVTVAETLHVWKGAQRPDFEGRASNASTIGMTVVDLSQAGRQAATQAASAAKPSPTTTGTGATEETQNPAGNDPRMLMLIGLIEALTGRKVKLFDPGMLKLGEVTDKRIQEDQAKAQNSQQQGWGVEYDRHETLRESELTRFSAEGVVRTSDGREIRFQLSLEMKREFFQQTDLSVRAGDGVKKDPLVINFTGTAAQLTDQKFAFDLNSDSQTEQMSFVGAGSGFLALDKNGNGVIDNGSELFGTQSGNGFADLAAYDSDENGWIDENDAVYAKLRVWSKDGSGTDQLSTLVQRNVGALYLGNVATPFDLKNGTNDLQGQVRSSGVYLNEDGSAGTLQQVDLVV